MLFAFNSRGWNAGPVRNHYLVKTVVVQDSEVGHHQTLEEEAYWENREKNAVLGR